MTERLPVLFIGHGSPMNIVSSNPYTDSLKKLSKTLPQPDAILVVSAHWLTDGTFVTSGEHPEQIYDFYGFPSALYKIIYRPPGSKQAAKKVISAFDAGVVKSDNKRGIDHAAWAVLCHLFPEQNIPVLELSLDIKKPPEYHFELGKKLKALRDQNILVIGSGNIVHNLYEIEMEESAEPFDWAIDFDKKVKERIEINDFDPLINYQMMGHSARLAVPTNEHYLPMLYSLAAKDKSEKFVFFHESMQNASISMRCFITE